MLGTELSLLLQIERDTQRRVTGMIRGHPSLTHPLEKDGIHRRLFVRFAEVSSLEEVGGAQSYARALLMVARGIRVEQKIIITVDRCAAVAVFLREIINGNYVIQNPHTIPC